jgi:hypothetical protein
LTALCLRIDLDYVPWDTPDAHDFGHGEPAMVLRLLEMVRQTGDKLHFFASNRSLRAFPTLSEAVLDDGHDLDWLCKHPRSTARQAEAVDLFAALGHPLRGLAVRQAWPEGVPVPEFTAFVSAQGVPPPGPRFFPVEVRSDRELARDERSPERWESVWRAAIREAASRRQGLTLCARPQVLARHDPHLQRLGRLLLLARGLDLPVRTLRDQLKPGENPGPT